MNTLELKKKEMKNLYILADYNVKVDGKVVTRVRNSFLEKTTLSEIGMKQRLELISNLFDNDLNALVIGGLRFKTSYTEIGRAVLRSNIKLVENAYSIVINDDITILIVSDEYMSNKKIRYCKWRDVGFIEDIVKIINSSLEEHCYKTCYTATMYFPNRNYEIEGINLNNEVSARLINFIKEESFVHISITVEYYSEGIHLTSKSNVIKYPTDVLIKCLYKV